MATSTANTNTVSPKQFGVHSQTGRIRAEVRMELAAESNHRIQMVIYAIKWALKTGRLRHEAEKLVDNLSGYQYAKWVCKFANSKDIATHQDVVDFLNGKKAIAYQPELNGR